MQAVILAGGLGSRLGEETETKPKPMVEIGGRPILWHVMKHYAQHGITEFCVALGYKGDVIKRYFLDYHHLNGSLTVDLAAGAVRSSGGGSEAWTVHLVDTGIATWTGGRVLKLRPWLRGEAFMATYGDGVSDIDLTALARFHRAHGRLATVTAVRPPARFGSLVVDGTLATRFVEKPQAGDGWINGGFLVFEPGVFDYLEDDGTSLESDALERLAADGQLAVFQHHGFWHCMDTLRDVRLLESLWQERAAPWKTWDQEAAA